MRKSVCEKLESNSGYIGTNQLLKAGVANRQIGTLTAEGGTGESLPRILLGEQSVLQKAKRV